jgi:hypothetical protein
MRNEDGTEFTCCEDSFKESGYFFLFICTLLQEFWCLKATFQVHILIVCKCIVYPCSVGRGQTLFLYSFRVASEWLEGGEGGLDGFRCRFFFEEVSVRTISQIILATK